MMCIRALLTGRGRCDELGLAGSLWVVNAVRAGEGAATKGGPMCRCKTAGGRGRSQGGAGAGVPVGLLMGLEAACTSACARLRPEIQRRRLDSGGGGGDDRCNPYCGSGPHPALHSTREARVADDPEVYAPGTLVFLQR